MEKKPLEFFRNEKGISAFFSPMVWGNMKGVGETAIRNRASFVERFFPECKFVFADVGHSSVVSTAGRHSYPIIHGVDALLSNDPAIVLGVTGDDCPTAYVWDSVAGVITLIHNSVYSLSAGVIPNAIDAMAMFGVNMDNVQVLIGPGIGTDHYEFGYQDAVKLFPEKKFRKYILQNKRNCSKCVIDLPSLIRRQMVDCGLRARNIHLSGICTFDHRGENGEPDLFSFRRMGRPNPVQAGLAVIGRR